MVGILFGRRAMYHQVYHQLLNPAQFGRPGGECQDASISKVLHNLVCSLTNTPMGQFESDAKSCFDREVMTFVLRCYHSMCAPMAPLQMWEEVLHNIVHKVKTGFGISNDGYSYSDNSPTHSPGQCSQGGAGSCSTAITLLIDVIHRLCHGLQLCNPSQQTVYTTTTNMFVDDVSNYTNRFVSWLHEPPALEEIAEVLHHDSQTWERLLWTSGELLNLLKCAYYILAWKFDAEGRPSPISKCDLPAVQLSSGNSPGTAPMTQLNFDETRRYLGNILSTDMQMKDASAALLQTSRSFASGILCSKLSKRDSWVAYFAVFVSSVVYSLPITHLSKTTLRKIQSVAIRTCLMKTGFNSNTAHRVVFGPSLHGGLLASETNSSNKESAKSFCSSDIFARTLPREKFSGSRLTGGN
jgi:hypothetical protein